VEHKDTLCGQNAELHCVKRQQAVHLVATGLQLIKHRDNFTFVLVKVTESNFKAQNSIIRMELLMTITKPPANSRNGHTASADLTWSSIHSVTFNITF
jgi:hypothetical protein